MSETLAPTHAEQNHPENGGEPNNVDYYDQIVETEILYPSGDRRTLSVPRWMLHGHRRPKGAMRMETHLSAIEDRPHA